MKKTSVLSGSAAEISAKKRQYSSTAVEFPIRIDLNAYSQGVLGVFPSWVRARCACTYVRGLTFCVRSASERLHYSLQSSYYLPVFCLDTPCDVHLSSSSSAWVSLELSSSARRVVRGCWLSCGNVSHSNNHRPPLFLLALSFLCARVISVLSSITTPGSLMVHLGVT